VSKKITVTKVAVVNNIQFKRCFNFVSCSAREVGGGGI